ncbi:MAG: hypothetical protein ABIQ40_00455 [Bacteroidia bacterium]
MRLSSLFRIALHHDYSRDGLCHGLGLIPSPATKAMMEKNGMMLKMRDGKYELVAESFADNNEVRYLPIGNFRFTFFLVLKDALFFNCTDLPLNAVHLFPSFSNFNKKDVTPLLLHTAETVTAEDLLEKIPLHGSLPVSEEGKAIIRNEAGEIVYETNATGKFLSYDISQEGNGKYSLELNGKPAGNFYACDLPFGMTIRGAIDIWHHTQVASAAKFLNEDNTVATKEYKVHFASRKTFWNYFLTGTALSRYQALAITDSKREVFFTGPQATKLFDGKEGLLFTSPQPLMLKETSGSSFQLRRNCEEGGNAGFSVIERLPMANAEILLQGTSGNEKEVFSEIIVYL